MFNQDKQIGIRIQPGIKHATKIIYVEISVKLSGGIKSNFENSKTRKTLRKRDAITNSLYT